MITIAAVDQQYVVMYNNSRISRFYKERRAAEAALHRMVRKQVVEYADRGVDYDEVADALWAMAHDPPPRDEARPCHGNSRRERRRCRGGVAARRV